MAFGLMPMTSFVGQMIFSSFIAIAFSYRGHQGKNLMLPLSLSAS
jgi:hypothetical protein